MEELSRARLLARLDAPLRLTILESLPGAGRSTLLRQWAEREDRSQGHRVVVTIDHEQRGPGSHLVQTLVAMVGAEVPVDLEVLHELALHEDPERLLPLSIAALAHLREPVTLIFLGWDLVQSRFLDFDAAGLMGAVPLLSVMVATVDGGPLAAFAATHGMAYQRLAEDDLYFSSEEVGVLLQRTAAEQDLPVREGAAEHLAQVTSGHPAMTTALLSTLPQLCTDGLVTREQGVRSVEWTLRDVDVTNLPPLYAFLRATAYARRFSPDVAAELCPGLETAVLVRRMLRDGRLMKTPPVRVPPTQPGGDQGGVAQALP